MEENRVVAIKEETFNEIKIYGFGVIDSLKSGKIYVKLDNGNIVSVEHVVSLEKWVEYVDSHEAEVTVVK